MASATLQSREIPPQRPAPMANTSGGCRNDNMEITYTGNTGNDMGISTMGFRASKYNPPEWHENNYSKYYQSFIDRDNGERIRHESKRTMNETEETTNKTQAEVTKKLGERIQDINFWKFELEREIRDVIDETDSLLAQKKRLENATRATEIPLHIATDNLNCRQRRENIDLVQDEVELSLLKEVEIINNVQDLLRKTTDQAEKQIKLNREAKQNLEMDWSDKKEALEIDSASGALKNHHTNKQFYPGAAKFQEIQSTPESWAQFTHDNIVRAEHERMSSMQLRQLIDNILEDTSRDMREQCDACDVAFQKRVTEMEDAKAKMEENLKKVCEEISQMEKNIENLKKAIRDKEDPMKVSQTRLENRTFRPGVELCRDPVQYKLVGEVNEIHSSIDALKGQLNHAQNSLKDLQDNRMGLEKEISIKKNSLFIDRDKCMTVRTRYPTTLKLQGYQWQAPKELSSVLLPSKSTAKKSSNVQLPMITDAKRPPQLLQEKRHNSYIEKNVENLKKAIRYTEDALMVSQTRLKNRRLRPCVELCRDPVQYKLVGEVNELHSSLNALTGQLGHAQNLLKDLQDNRIGLAKDISIQKNSLFIDRDKCMIVRTRYPTALKLQGFQLINKIHSSIDALKRQPNHAQNLVKDLQDNRIGLAKDISIKKNKLFIDKYMNMRTRFPAILKKLHGYQ